MGIPEDKYEKLKEYISKESYEMGKRIAKKVKTVGEDIANYKGPEDSYKVTDDAFELTAESVLHTGFIRAMGVVLSHGELEAMDKLREISKNDALTESANLMNALHRDDADLAMNYLKSVLFRIGTIKAVDIYRPVVERILSDIL